MSSTATTTPSGPGEMSGQVLAEAARRMLPVLATKVLAALADQAVARVDELADRLDDRAHGASPGERSPARRGDADEEDGAAPSMVGTAMAVVAEQVRTALAVLARLVAQAAEMLRRATERLRARRAPEGIEAEHEEIDDIDLDESEYEVTDAEDDSAVDEGDRVPA